jgi:nucleotide-binding universal stress UspA family protein
MMEDAMYKKVLIPLDGSERTAKVIPYVEDLVRCIGAKIELICVVVYPHYDFLLRDPELSETIMDGLENEACKYLSGYANQLKAAGFEVSAEVVRSTGTIPDAILTFAEETAADMIAMTSKVSSGPLGWMQSSITDAVVKRAKVPVLLVKAE